MTFEPTEVRVLDQFGYVALTDVMGDDRTPARTARTSFRTKVEKTAEEDAKLTDYLVRNRHNTPIEFCQVRFYVKLPIFVARQFVRHRTQSINEISYRYVQAAREFYVPAPERMQKKAENNKQGSSSEIVDDPELCRQTMDAVCNICFNGYEGLLANGLAPELARTILPVATYTEWYAQMNLANFMHMYGLRSDPHAQWEIREYAAAMISLVEPVFPTVIGSYLKANGKS